jgi:hypothetical protein
MHFSQRPWLQNRFQKIIAVLGSTEYSLNPPKECRARVKASELSHGDEFFCGHPSHVLGKALSSFLNVFLLRQQESLLNASVNLLKVVPHSSSECSKRELLIKSIDISTVVRGEANNFSGL